MTNIEPTILTRKYGETEFNYIVLDNRFSFSGYNKYKPLFDVMTTYFYEADTDINNSRKKNDNFACF